MGHHCAPSVNEMNQPEYWVAMLMSTLFSGAGIIWASKDGGGVVKDGWL
jgi:hypothetical protein